MNNTQVKSDSQNKSKSKESLRGETHQKHVFKGKKERKINPQTVAARQALIDMSQEAQNIMLTDVSARELAGFVRCFKVNDYLLIMHKKATGCSTFETFHDWKKAGYSVKKGAKSCRVWGSPLKARKQGEEQQAEAAPETEGKNESGEIFKFWPMCNLFNENQVESIEGGEETQITENKEPEKAPTEQTIKPVEKVRLAEVRVPMTPKSSKITEKPQAEAANNTTIPETNAFVTADYQEQQEARKDRMLGRADKASAESQATYSRAKDMASVIPFGQPILVGHHSEQRDRNYRHKINNNFGKSFALADKAEHYKQKAASVGHTGIASNDPEAIDKLNNKLAGLELCGRYP